MLGWMDAEALRRTLTEGRVTFWSRSRQEYWRKGDTPATCSTCAARRSTATAIRCWSRSSRSAPPATPAPTPASTSIRSRRSSVTRTSAYLERHLTPTTRADFDALLAAGHRVVPVLRELFADGETPIGIYRKLAVGKPGTFLLESAEQGGIWSRSRSSAWSRSACYARAATDAARLARLRRLGRARPRHRRRPPLRSRRSRTSTPAGARRTIDGHPAAHRRPGRVHRLGGDPPARAAADIAARRLRIPARR